MSESSMKNNKKIDSECNFSAISTQNIYFTGKKVKAVLNCCHCFHDVIMVILLLNANMRSASATN